MKTLTHLHHSGRTCKTFHLDNDSKLTTIKERNILITKLNSKFHTGIYISIKNKKESNDLIES